MRLARAFQVPISGSTTNLSAAAMPSTAMAAIVSSCWRFLICTVSSLVPGKAKGKLNGRGLAAGLPQVDFGNLPDSAQLSDGFEQRGIVSGHTGAGHCCQVPNFHSFCRHAAIFGKGGGQ